MARSFLTRWIIVCITLLLSLWLITRSHRTYGEMMSSIEEGTRRTKHGIGVATGSKSFAMDELDENGDSKGTGSHNWVASGSSSSSSSLSSIYDAEQQQQQQGHPQISSEGIVDKPAIRTLIVSASWIDDIMWLERLKEQDPNLRIKVYNVHDKTSSERIPANKGREAMVYLTYIINALNSTSETLDTLTSPSDNELAEESGLTDVQIFIHAHDTTWHNNDLLNSSTPWMISRLNSAKVQREGFLNLRCHWGPGCDGNPLEPGPCARGEKEMNPERPEECQLATAWGIFFPNETVPEALSAPCCAQFAVSREQIARIPLERYVAMRDWLLETPLPDRISGRVFEYTWHYLFGQRHEVCPETEWGCYCDAYGICFDDGPAGYVNWMNKTQRTNELKGKANEAWYEQEQRTLIEKIRANQEHAQDNQSEDLSALPPSTPKAKMDAWIQEVHVLEGELKRAQDEAVRNGNDAVLRSKILEEGQGKGEIWRSEAKGNDRESGTGRIF